MNDTPESPLPSITLRELSLPARLVLSAFLISVGIGYTSALVQLHFQHARPGELLPNKDDAARVYYGVHRKVGMIERLISAHEDLPFNGTGSMRAAFFKKSAGWIGQVKKKARALKISEAEAEQVLRKERDLEIDAIVLWLEKGATQADYATLQLPDSFFKSIPEPLDDEVFAKDKDGKYTASIGEIFSTRCARCHKEGGGGTAGQIHLSNYDEVKDYVAATTDGGSSGMSLIKLAQSTHVHLLGFSMLYGLTGLILAFSSYPCWLKVVLCPLPLVAQVADISCWWLGRIDPIFAHFIIYTGGVVALGLMLHIVLSLLNMYGIAGKLILLLLLGAAGGGAFLLKTEVIDPFLAKEKAGLVAPGEK